MDDHLRPVTDYFLRELDTILLFTERGPFPEANMQYYIETIHNMWRVVRCSRRKQRAYRIYDVVALIINYRDVCDLGLTIYSGYCEIDPVSRLWGPSQQLRPCSANSLIAEHH